MKSVFADRIKNLIKKFEKDLMNENTEAGLIKNIEFECKMFHVFNGGKR